MSAQPEARLPVVTLAEPGSLPSSVPQRRAQGCSGPLPGALQKGGGELPRAGKDRWAGLWVLYQLCL